LHPLKGDATHVGPSTPPASGEFLPEMARRWINMPAAVHVLFVQSATATGMLIRANNKWSFAKCHATGRAMLQLRVSFVRWRSQ